MAFFAKTTSSILFVCMLGPFSDISLWQASHCPNTL